MLLGVPAVIAKSFERIHRSNLAGMGVLPLQFDAGQDARTLGLTGQETFAVTGVAKDLAPKKKLTVTATDTEGKKTTFTVTVRLDTPNEVDYYRHGGILTYVLRQLAAAGRGILCSSIEGRRFRRPSLSPVSIIDLLFEICKAPFHERDVVRNLHGQLEGAARRPCANPAAFWDQAGHRDPVHRARGRDRLSAGHEGVHTEPERLPEERDLRHA